MAKQKKTELKHKAVTDIQHVLLRSQMYIGTTTETVKNSYYVDDIESPSILNKDFEYIPALLTLFNEIINNSYDEHVKQKAINPKNPKLQNIKVILNKEEGYFDVYDDGGIPIVLHTSPNPKFEKINKKIDEFVELGYLEWVDEFNRVLKVLNSGMIKRKLSSFEDDISSFAYFVKTLKNGTEFDGSKWSMWLPQMLFGSLKTSSNYDDDERKDVGGTNGVGASLVNIFSKKFIVSSSDGVNVFNGEWSNNMRNIDSIQINECINGVDGHEPHTRIRAYLDEKQITTLDNGFSDDLLQLYIMRCLEISAMGSNTRKPLNLHLTVIADGETIENTYKFKRFNEFTKMFKSTEEYIADNSNDRMEFQVGASSNGEFESFALVNSIRCDEGTHVEYIVDKVAQYLINFMDKKHKIKVSRALVKKRLSIISRWKIDKPVFSDQTKYKIVSKPTTFGFPLKIDTKFLKKLEKSEIVEQIKFAHSEKQSEADAKAIREHNKRKKPTYISGLIDATGKNRKKCTLFIVEGDSAGAGFRKSANGEFHGLFRLRGKFKNTLESSMAELVKLNADKKPLHKEVVGIMEALGLEIGKPVDYDKLRYHNIAIMTDADVDGYSIACGVINFFARFWGELLTNGNIYRVQTPIVISTKKGQETRRYYNQASYQEESELLEKGGWKSKHMKGLGSLSDEEYKIILNTPYLEQITVSENMWGYIDAWFGKGKLKADLRKRLINDEDISKEIINKKYRIY